MCVPGFTDIGICTSRLTLQLMHLNVYKTLFDRMVYNICLAGGKKLQKIVNKINFKILKTLYTKNGFIAFNFSHNNSSINHRHSEAFKNKKRIGI